jgi:glycine/D-amino acid oxidase-like deaminating enzyme
MDPPPARYAPLSQNMRCDVAIIGGGITGALAAHHLTEAGLGVVLLDRRHVGEGSTAASTGLLQYEIDTPMVELAAKIGAGGACQGYRAAYDALLQFEPLVASLGDDCGLRRKRSLYLAAEARERESFRDEQAARRACGIDVEFISAGQLRQAFGIARPAALLSPLAYEVDPYRLAAAAIRKAVKGGACVFGETEACEYVLGGDHVTLRTRTGFEVRARHVIFATGYETPEFVRLNVQLKSTYAFVSEPLAMPNCVVEGHLIWESARPYLYVREAPGGRLMIGGEDVSVVDAAGRDALIPQKTAALIEKFHGLFPGQQIVPEIGWAGTFAETADGLPLIGPARDFPRGIFALGYGGNGITFSLLAAEMIRDALMGRGHRHAELFRLDR